MPITGLNHKLCLSERQFNSVIWGGGGGGGADVTPQVYLFWINPKRWKMGVFDKFEIQLGQNWGLVIFLFKHYFQTNNSSWPQPL